jgi:hypothetical protein
MSSPTDDLYSEPLDLSRWRNVPAWLMAVGGLVAAIGAIHDYRQFSYSWLLAFMFFLSLGLGGLIMVILHHLFDAAWSVPTRRFCEHMACLLPWLGVLFIPIALNVMLAKGPNNIYPWVEKLKAGGMDHALASKQPLFTIPSFILTGVFNFGIWTLLAYKLRFWSLKQDETGDANCTVMMRRYSASGVVLFALTLTLGAIVWMKSLQDDWYSTMYGVWYFAATVWTTIFTIYVITAILKRHGPLRNVATQKTFYFIGSLMFAFTVFYAYITFFQYFIIWNANMPEETSFYVAREAGGWWWASMVIIFGHFFLPFLLLLRIDIKLTWAMLPLAGWAWLMHFIDMSFNIMPVLHPKGYHLDPSDLGCMAFMCGFLSWVFLKNLNAHPMYPQKDPRIAEAMDVYVRTEGYVPTASESGGGH